MAIPTTNIPHGDWCYCSQCVANPKLATGELIARRSAAACSPSSGGQEPEQEKCGTTHYAGCACHEQGWKNKWKAAIEMAARAQLERDAAIRVLESIEERYIDGCDTYEDWKFMGSAARNFLYTENASVEQPERDQ